MAHKRIGKLLLIPRFDTLWDERSKHVRFGARVLSHCIPNEIVHGAGEAA